MRVVAKDTIGDEGAAYASAEMRRQHVPHVPTTCSSSPLS